MAYVDQIKSEIQAVDKEMNQVLKRLYRPKEITDCVNWCLTEEDQYIERIDSLLNERAVIVDNMKTSLWTDNYWTPIINAHNQLVDQMVQFFDYFEKGNSSIFEGSAFGQIDVKYQNMILHGGQCAATIRSVVAFLDSEKYLEALKIGYDSLNYSIWANMSIVTAEQFLIYKKAYYQLCRYFNIDLLCAEIYLYHQLNKQNQVNNTIYDYLNNRKIMKNQLDLDLLSSALEWMKNEEGLRIVLTYMKDKSYNLSYPRKQRLNELSNVVFKKQFKITSGNKQINDMIMLFQSSISSYYRETNVQSSISYEIALKENKLPYDAAASYLQTIRHLNSNRYLSPREKLRESELGLLQVMYSDFNDFNTKNRILNCPLYYLENKEINEAYFYDGPWYDNPTLKKELLRISSILDTDFDDDQWQTIWKYDPSYLIRFAMNCAIGVKYGKKDEKLFYETKGLFYRLVRYFNIHMYLCELEYIIYSQGKEYIQFNINSYLKNDDLYKCQDDLDALSNFLEYHDLHAEEQIVYQYMLDHKMSLSNHKAKRLYYLNNHSEDAPKTFEVSKKSNHGIYFDVSSLGWKEDNVNDLFKELQLNNKSIDYSLAISLEDNDLVIPAGIQLDAVSKIVELINYSFNNEYGFEEVIAHEKMATILSDINEEINGFIVDVNECKTMKLFVHLMKIGKKLNIRFYTLYTPDNQDLTTQKAQLMSMMKHVSPTMSLWEKSIKNSILTVLQYMLNRNQNNSMNNRTQIDEF